MKKLYFFLFSIKANFVRPTSVRTTAFIKELPPDIGRRTTINAVVIVLPAPRGLVAKRIRVLPYTVPMEAVASFLILERFAIVASSSQVI